MATPAESIERIVAASGLLPTTVDRTADFLRRAKRDLWPTSGKGGGKAAVHVEAYHLTNLILALMAYQPSDAVGAVDLARPIPESMTRNQETLGLLMQEAEEWWTMAGADALTLGETLDRIISRLADVPAHIREVMRKNWNETFCRFAVNLAYPGHALVTSLGSDGQGKTRVRHTHYAYSPDVSYRMLLANALAAGTRPSGWITTERGFPVDLLFTAAELVADTRSRRAGRLPLAATSENSAARNENAPDLPGSRASTTTNQPREPHAAGHYSDNPESKRVCADYQAHTGSRGTSPTGDASCRSLMLT